MKVMVRDPLPNTQLRRRKNDVDLPEEHLLQISLFERLHRKPSLSRFPGKIALRFYRKGEALFRQGHPGTTAFYVLTTEDVVRCRTAQLQHTLQEKERWQLAEDVGRWQKQAELIARESDNLNHRIVGTAQITVRPEEQVNRRRFQQRLRRVKSRPVNGGLHVYQDRSFFVLAEEEQSPKSDSLRAPLLEGELLGEMSCLYQTPRPATVILARDCFVLEMMREVFDQIHPDPIHRAYADSVYPQGDFPIQLQDHPLFGGLTQQEYHKLAQHVELVRVEPGQLICSEHGRASELYLIRRGLVQISRGVSWLLAPQDVLNWPVLLTILQGGASKPASPHYWLWSLLAQPAQELVQRHSTSANLDEPTKRELLQVLNDLILSREPTRLESYLPLMKTPLFQSQLGELPEDRSEWTDLQVQMHNRVLLEMLFRQLILSRKHVGGAKQVLNWCSEGNTFGELDVMQQIPRSITAMAWGHPGQRAPIELVRIPATVLWQLAQFSPTVRDRITRIVAAPDEYLPAHWGASHPLQGSHEFEGLGLIQGRQLMLIDLDRCTRCDECTRACAGIQKDEHSRLSLQGPKLGKYLIPTACRACLDPVCTTGCPVDAIYQGDNGDIHIEDWCIGCSACADSCPYGAIQNCDVGILPANASGWRYSPAYLLADKSWQSRGFRDSSWSVGESPFSLDRDLVSYLRAHARLAKVRLQDLALCFRRELTFTREQAQNSHKYRIEVLAEGASVRVWLNGKELKVEGAAQRTRRTYLVPSESTFPLGVRDLFHVGRNVLAVEVLPPKNLNDTFFQLRLDQVHKPQPFPEIVADPIVEELRQKIVTHRAVVCDQCSQLSLGKPACAQACAHDAILRVNARESYPV